ncbi:MAG: FtsX-like permease family protein [Chloroflexi bacterium]|nr:FtsX-like permease family protein [Chloroflexota bacterium]OJV90062.1 MAG: hypothetical protein BGO39_01395 [Chloroflexi bacterium 54-19]
MARIKLWLRWSWRDLRARWLQVVAVAFIIALGSGVYAGLGSNTPWRQASYDASYKSLNMYDLRVVFTKGSYLPQNQVLQAVGSIEHANWIKGVEPRLISPVLVDSSTATQTILTPGRMVGVDVSRGGPFINAIHLNGGRPLGPGDAGQPKAILEYHFAKNYNLPAQGKVKISGDVPLDYVGTGMSPEYFVIVTEEGAFLAESNFAVLFVPLQTAQTLANQPGWINDLVLKLAPGSNLEVLKSEIEQKLAATGSDGATGVGISFMLPQEDKAYNTLYQDIGGDQEFFNLIAYLFLAGAVLGAFNLVSRMIEAQRREIGINMALGVPPRLIVIRPLLFALQIALLGVIGGFIVGVVLNNLWSGVLRDLFPMPIFDTPFQWQIFGQATLLGLALPFVAALYPVWRAVRVLPVDAIRTGYLAAKGNGLAPWLARLHLPGKSFTQMPLRNVLRAPRRSLFTLLGIAMAVTTLIAVMGMLDTFFYTIDIGKAEFLQNSPQRLMVELDSFYPQDAPQVSALKQSPLLSKAENGLRLPGQLSYKGAKLDTVIELVNLDSALWQPTLVEGQRHSAGPGVLLAEKAARDLGVKAGDKLNLRHPQREGLFAYKMVETPVEVSGIHAGPLRFMSYMDLSQASLMGLSGLTNYLQINPAPNVSQSEVQRSLFAQPGVASVQPISAVVKTFEDLTNLFVAFLGIVAVTVVILAFLIAFNSTSINVDERSREIATMFAFGLPVRVVVRMTMLENLIMGLLGTVLGIGLGYAALVWMMEVRMATMIPDIQVSVSVSTLTAIMAVIMGVVVVAFTPLFSVAKLTRMNLPATLRVVE